MKWLASAVAVALACVCALSIRPAAAQVARDPLIVPEEGGKGSRFQIVGQFGWAPGETVTLSFAFTTANDPLAYNGPFERDRRVTVLRDGTWSFPINVNDDLLSHPLDDTPGYIVVRAQSAGRTAINAFIFSPNGQRPAGAAAIAHLGFGPQNADPTLVGTLALFVAGAGALLIGSGMVRRRGALAT
ncbi:MAG TPA: hypothetical protein VEZ14_04385 [Dehalococcoidia bacterium]|nr:hypothetical protein [Dehalococcoidia bacterium]